MKAFLKPFIAGIAILGLCGFALVFADPREGKKDTFSDSGSETESFSDLPTPTFTPPQHGKGKKPKPGTGDGDFTIQQVGSINITPKTKIIPPGGTAVFSVTTVPVGTPWSDGCFDATVAPSGAGAIVTITNKQTTTNPAGMGSLTVQSVGNLSGISTISVTCDGVTATATVEVGHVDIVNNTRPTATQGQFDKVVPAKGGGTLNLPGGTKQVGIKISPFTTVTLDIVRTAGGAGSANFSGGNATLTVTNNSSLTNTHSITIFGDELSDTPRNLLLQARIGETIRNTFSFTSIGLTLSPITSGPSTQIPIAAKTQGGSGAQALRDLYNSANVRPDGQFGWRVKPDNSRIEGGIYFIGRVLPPGMDPSDFGKGRFNGFDNTRTIFLRWYFPGDCIGQFGQTPGDAFFTHNELDDADDLSEDDLPNADIQNDSNLYVHAIDNVWRATTAALVGNNQKMRFRFNADESFNYAGVRASNVVQWHVAFSCQRDNAGNFGTLTDAGAADNKLGLGHILLTTNLQAPQGNPPVITALTQPANGEVTAPAQGSTNFQITITGQDFTDPDCPIKVIFRRQEVNANATSVFRINVTNIAVNAAGTQIDGTITIPSGQKKGKYTLQVFKDGHPAGELVDALEVK